MYKRLASVVIPVYNQASKLQTLLQGFSRQTIDPQNFELVIIDDGSTDDVNWVEPESIYKEYGLSCVVTHTLHTGRSHARNTGISLANAPIIIFCDADRIPCANFIEKHIENHDCNENAVVVGAAYDYYGTQLLVQDQLADESEIKKKSRIPRNYRKLYAILQDNNSRLRWLSFLVGNSSVKKHTLIESGGFSEQFIDWGMEHFELGYRLFLNNCPFLFDSDIISFHIPHNRNSIATNQDLFKSASVFNKLHPEINSNLICRFLLGDCDIGDLKNNLFF